MNCTFGNSKELPFIAERSKKNLEEQLLSYMVFMYRSQFASEFTGISMLGNRERACSLLVLKEENPTPFACNPPPPTNTHSLSSIFLCFCVYLYLLKTNTSLFHKHFPVPLARQNLAQAQTCSRVG